MKMEESVSPPSGHGAAKNARLQIAAPEHSGPGSKAYRIVWEGNFFNKTSFMLANERLLSLATSGCTLGY